MGDIGEGFSKDKSSAPTPEDAPELPSSFSTSRQQRSFVREKEVPKRTATPLSSQERMHFSKLQGSFGARMLSKMGWEAGTGLGSERTGIVTPIESKLRPKNMGIAYKGFGEKTDQSKAEARRRGEKVSDDEDEKKPPRGKGKGKDVKREREDAWKKPKKSKLKVEHKTYEEILAEAGTEPAPSGVGIIIDATGATMREVSSLADVSGWIPSMDPTRIPEVRHNIRMISDACKTDLDGLAREAKVLEDRKKWIDREDPKVRRKVEDEAELIRRLQAVHLVVDEINLKAREVAQSDYEPTLDIFDEHIDKLLNYFGKEYERYRLDEIVVAAITPIFRRMMSAWRPSEDPSAYTGKLRRWKTALKMNDAPPETGLQVDVYGGHTVTKTPMTPYESLLWNIWLPRVRSFINNEWTPDEPQQAVKLFEAWSDVLPTFIQDNVLDQLILPKISATVSAWNPKRDKFSLHAVVFPWLPHVGLRMEEFVDAGRRKVKSLLRSWMTSEGVPKDLRPWREVFKSADWESMLLKYVIPKLGATLRDDFRVNPRNQDMAPLQQILEWANIIRPSIFGQLLETEFFPKWLDVLHIWLIQPSVNFEEVAQWYAFWKGSIPEDVRRIPAVEAGFTKGLQLINEALELGPDAPRKLPKPNHNRPPSPSEGDRKPKPQRTLPSRMQEITFKSIVEDFVASHNLLLLPAGKVHEKSRMPLFRITKTVEGKGGLLVYLLDDAVWASEGDEYRAITLEDMVLRATKAR
ncbi:TFP11-domain-containing protein [Schizopora paradoxa]|uniref:TFP11-domain-containing protein n=1 Tax=Schizopora paradoxa TaxID=27342 RepID=A0A0H2RGS5_9AGAM|nr:TFP11-domain-containing protein [Schizopora paradoxa]